jgi:hypothetical protein
MSEETAYDVPPDSRSGPIRTPMPPSRESTIIRRMLGAIPPRNDDEIGPDIGAEAASAALKRSEARRDAVLAVLLAIRRRGGNPITDWTSQDADAAYAIADILIGLE